MYTTNRRYLERLPLEGRGVSPSYDNRPDHIHYSTPQLVEGVYSWRTGARAISDPPESPQTHGGHDGYGIRTPRTSGSLVDRLADRKRYLEEFQRAAFPAETQTGSTSTNRTSTTDSGHLFAHHRTFRQPFVGRLVYDERISATVRRTYDGDIWASLDAGLWNPSSYSFGFATKTSSDLQVSSANRQAMANRYFSATAPDKNEGSLMVTLIELLRGDIPSVLKNFRELMSGLKSVQNYAGSEALNIMFGWVPLIQEYANLIKVGMALERVIYYESFRRKRQWDGPSVSGTSSPSVLLSCSGSAYGVDTLHRVGDVLGGTTGVGASFYAAHRWVESEDYHFSSKYTGLAKAGRRANAFSDQAMDVVKRLGLVDDPQMLWELTPYSWLVDWFTSMGASISNANVYSPVRGKYNVDYAYLTTQRIRSSEADLSRPVSALGANVKSLRVTRPRSIAISTTRWRDRATPFGFGTQLGSLSGSQFAILVALGFARFR